MSLVPVTSSTPGDSPTPLPRNAHETVFRTRHDIVEAGATISEVRRDVVDTQASVHHVLRNREHVDS